MSNDQFLTSTEVADRVGTLLGRVVSPREISAALRRLTLPDDAVMMVGNRRLLRRSVLPAIVTALRSRGARRPGVAES